VAVTWQLVIDCADPGRMVRFWGPAIAYVPAPPPQGHATWTDFYRSVGVPEEELADAGDGTDSIVDPSGQGPRIWFQVVPERKSVKNRFHLDVQVGGGRAVPLPERRVRVDAAVERLLAAGATRRPAPTDGTDDHYAVAMLDPEGNEFDVV